MAIVVNISLDPDKDKDIMRWLSRQSNRSQAVREAIRYYIAKEEGVTLADVLAEVRALPSRFSIVAMSPEPILAEGEEPEAAAINLDGLIDRLGNGNLG